MSDQFEDEARPRPSEGVRILGAEEAQAALERASRSLRTRRRSPSATISTSTTTKTRPKRSSPRPTRPRQPRYPSLATPISSSTSKVPGGRLGSPTRARLGRRARRANRRHRGRHAVGRSAAAAALDRTAHRRGAGDLRRQRRCRRPRRLGRNAARPRRVSGPKAPTGPTPTSPKTISPTRPARSARSRKLRVVDEDEAFARDLEARRRTPRGQAARTMATADAGAGRGRGDRDTGQTPPVPAPDAGIRPRSRQRWCAEPRPPDRARHRGCRHRRRAASASPRARSGPSLLGVGDRRRSARSSSPTACKPAGSVRPRRSRSIGALTLPIAAREFGTAAYPVFFGLDRRVLDVVVPVGDHARPPAARRRDDGARVRVRRRARRIRGPVARVGDDGVGLILGVALCVIAYDVVRVLRRFAVRQEPDRAACVAEQVVRRHPRGHGRPLRCSSAGSSFGRIEPWSPGKGAVLGLFVAAGAFLGDLCESMLKRDLGVKDFGIAAPRPRRRPRPVRLAPVLPADHLLPGRSTSTSSETLPSLGRGRLAPDAPP